MRELRAIPLFLIVFVCVSAGLYVPFHALAYASMLTYASTGDFYWSAAVFVWPGWGLCVGFAGLLTVSLLRFRLGVRIGLWLLVIVLWLVIGARSTDWLGLEACSHEPYEFGWPTPTWGAFNTTFVSFMLQPVYLGVGMLLGGMLGECIKQRRACRLAADREAARRLARRCWRLWAILVGLVLLGSAAIACCVELITVVRNNPA